MAIRQSLALLLICSVASAQTYYFPPPGMTYTASPSSLGQTSASPVTQSWLDSSASVNAKLWRRVVSGSATASGLHEQSCTDAPVCTDWLTLTRTDAAHPGIVDSAKLFTSSAGFETSLAITPDQMEFKMAESGDSIDMIVGSGDLLFQANLNAEALFAITNGNGGIDAWTHFRVGANSQIFEFQQVPTTATAISSDCAIAGGLAFGLTCWTDALPIGITVADTSVTYVGADGLIAEGTAHAVGDTHKFFYIPTVAGVPTGVPASLTGIYNTSSPMRFDSTDNRLYVYNSGWKAFGVNTGSANPSATIGLSAVNGTATTFLTSDSAPALSQAIVPTWSGTHTFSTAIVSNSASTGATNLHTCNPALGSNLKCWGTRIGTTGSYALTPETDALAQGSTNALVIGKNSSQAVTSIAIGNSTDNPPVTIGGTLQSAGAAATVASAGCGTIGSVTSAQQAGSLTSGTTGTCTFTVTFSQAAAHNWSCWLSDTSTGVAGAQKTNGSPTTAATIAVTTTSGDTVVWGCLGF